jgi:nanoRNase/pAp phosphatase (c-di-AMP/oligoRNAs hydrolase)
MVANRKSYRLVTRPDFDGLACAILLRHVGLTDGIKFVHPKDMQDGLIDISDGDITANLPYVKGVHLAFDHHYSETLRAKGAQRNHIIDPTAPSTARIIYKYYGGTEKFPAAFDELIAAVDKCDAGQLTKEEVLHPTEWVLLYFILDIRTGLGRFRDYRKSTDDFILMLIDYCKDHGIDNVLRHPQVKERIDLYFSQQAQFEKQLKACATVRGNVLVLDMRKEKIVYSGNRYMKYVLFPKCNICIQVLWGVDRQNTVLSVGRSIFNPTSKANVGEILLRYGGGHINVGTCQVSNDRADALIAELVGLLKD